MYVLILCQGIVHEKYPNIIYHCNIFKNVGCQIFLFNENRLHV